MARRKPRFQGVTGGGGGPSTPPAEPPPEGGPEVFTVLASPSGGQLGISKVTPAAFYYNGSVYFGWTSTSDNVMVSKYVLATGTVTSTILDTSVESHAAPSVVVRPDGKIRVMWSKHDATTAKQAISNAAEDISSFTTDSDLDAQFAMTGTYTYLSQVYLATEDRDYVFWRELASGVGYLAYSTSDDGGETWAAGTRLVKPTPTSANRVYWRVGSNWTDRIDILTTDTSRTDALPSSLYHLYHAGGAGTAWFQSNGTAIAVATPFEASSGTLVADEDDVGPIDPGGVSWDGTNPGGVFVAYQSSGTANNVYSARYSGGAWSYDLVDGTGGLIASNRFVGSLACPEDSPDTVYFPKKVGSKFEMHRGVTEDAGTTWDVEALTSAGVDTMLPQPVHLATDGMLVLWSAGTWVSDSNYTLGISAYGTAVP